MSTTRRNLQVAACVALAAAAGTPTVRAAEGYDNCEHFVDALPATIAQQGVWCLRGDLSTATSYNGFAAIDIGANNVTLDCNGFKLGGLAAGTGTLAAGIRSDTNRMNTTIRNCRIRGFAYGIVLSYNGGGHLVEDNRLESNRVLGIVVHGDGSVVRRNRVIGTGGSGMPGGATGIYTSFDVDVVDNLVSGVSPLGGLGLEARGIVVNGSGLVSGNRVREVVADPAATTRGIHVAAAGQRTNVRGNDVAAAASGGDSGIACADALASARENTVTGFATGLSCPDHGGNVVK